MRTSWYLLAVLLFLPAAACGGSKAGQARATPTATAVLASPTPPVLAAAATLAPDVSATLNKNALTAADLPPGYTLGGKLTLDNAGAVEGYANTQAALMELQSDGREGGIAQQVMALSAGGDQFGATVDLFTNAAGAQQWLDHPPAFPASMPTTRATPPSGLGDQATAFHWTQGTMAGYILNFRRGRIVYGLGLSATTGTESLATLTTIASNWNKRIAQGTN